MTTVYDYVGFSLDDKHSIRDFGIYRTSTSKRYADSFTPQLNDTKQNITGLDGAQFVRSQYKERTFSINYAFDHMTEEQVHDWRKLCSSNQFISLVFDEAPYKQWDVRISGTPSFKCLSFLEYVGSGDARTLANVYKGEGTLQLIAYYPFAHNPSGIWSKTGDTITYTAKSDDVQVDNNTAGLNTYGNTYYTNKDYWKPNAGLMENSTRSPLYSGKNYGDIPTPFRATIGSLVVNTDYTLTLRIATTSGSSTTYSTLATLTFKAPATSVKWDSETGLLTYVENNITKVLQYTVTAGSGCCKIPVTASNETFQFRLGEAAASVTSLIARQWYY